MIVYIEIISSNQFLVRGLILLNLFLDILGTTGKKFINFVSNIGHFFIFFGNAIYWALKPPWYLKKIFQQIIDIGYFSLPVVGLTTFFSGMVLALQTYNGFTDFNSESTVARIVLTSITRELGPVLTGLMVAGRIGAKMAAEIATMRVTEQIDALEVMGINSLNYLVFPKIIAMLLYPFIITISMFLGIIGGLLAMTLTGVPSEAYIEGIQTDFDGYHVTYSYVKTLVFSFVLATVPAFHGYYMKGGALDVGKASTQSFYWTSIIIIILNYIITQLLLA